MKIQKKESKKEECMNLLLEADPSKEIVKKYLQDGELYVGIENNKIICEILITKVDDNTCELKNIATKKEDRGKGYATKLIEYVSDIYREKYKKMIVGTTENMIPFYVLNGFTKYDHTVKNFFVDNYEQEIWNGNLHCIDMYYYAKIF